MFLAAQLSSYQLGQNRLQSDLSHSSWMVISRPVHAVREEMTQGTPLCRALHGTPPFTGRNGQ